MFYKRSFWYLLYLRGPSVPLSLQHSLVAQMVKVSAYNVGDLGSSPQSDKLGVILDSTFSYS